MQGANIEPTTFGKPRVGSKPTSQHGALGCARGRKHTMTICCCCHIGGPAEVSDADLPPARSNLVVTVLTRKDEAEAVRVGSAGFAGNGSAPGEPVQAWVLGGDPTGALPTAAGRQAHIDYIIRCSFLQAQSFGGVVLGAKLDGQLAGIAIAYPPGRMSTPHRARTPA